MHTHSGGICLSWKEVGVAENKRRLVGATTNSLTQNVYLSSPIAFVKGISASSS